MPELEICRERVLSDDYRDFIVSQLGAEEFRNIVTEDTCQQEMEFIYKVIHVEKTMADPISLDRYSYNSIPKCFTLLDMEAMNQA